MKQTAVEWLEKELLKNGYVNKGYYNQDSLNHLEGLLEQAKEMEKQQIIDAIEDGRYEFGYEYYRDTYGSKGSDDHIVDTNEMASSQTEISDEVTRLEVIDKQGRVYSQWNCSIELSYQDDGKTLKIFVNN